MRCSRHLILVYSRNTLLLPQPPSLQRAIFATYSRQYNVIVLFVLVYLHKIPISFGLKRRKRYTSHLSTVNGTSRPKYGRQRRNRRQRRKKTPRRTSSKKRQRTVQNFTRRS